MCFGTDIGWRIDYKKCYQKYSLLPAMAWVKISVQLKNPACAAKCLLKFLIIPFSTTKAKLSLTHTSVFDQLHLSFGNLFGCFSVGNVHPAQTAFLWYFVDQWHFDVRLLLSILKFDVAQGHDVSIQTLNTINPLAQLRGSSPSVSISSSFSASFSSFDQRVCHFSVEMPDVKRRSTGIIAIFSDKRYVRNFSENMNFASGGSRRT